MKANSGNLELGELLRVYKSSVSNYWWALFISIGLLLILLIFVWAASIHGTSHLELLPVYAIGGFLAAVPIAGLIYQLKNSARFYENGLVYENRRSIKAARWADIRDVWEWGGVVDADGSPLPTQMFYFVRTVGGPTIRFSPRLGDTRELGEFLKAEATRWGVPIRAGIPPQD